MTLGEPCGVFQGLQNIPLSVICASIVEVTKKFIAFSEIAWHNLPNKL